MAICSWCEREMKTADSCIVSELHLHGKPIPMTPYGRELVWERPPRCGDCGVHLGGLHHLGCDVQRCPICSGQMLSCGCRFDEDRYCDLEVDGNGDPMERITVGGQEVVVHYADIPDKDKTVLRGIPCTTALRTVIDVAADISEAQLRRIVDDVLARDLFTLAEARTRLAG